MPITLISQLTLTLPQIKKLHLLLSESMNTINVLCSEYARLLAMHDKNSYRAFESDTIPKINGVLKDITDMQIFLNSFDQKPINFANEDSGPKPDLAITRATLDQMLRLARNDGKIYGALELFHFQLNQGSIVINTEQEYETVKAKLSEILKPKLSETLPKNSFD